MKKTHDPKVCTVKTCERAKDGPAPLVCPAHWALTPRKLKKALWDAMKVRSTAKREPAIWEAADNILRYLEKLKVQLPPETKLITSLESEVEKPDAKILTP